ncbi:MAG TPA: FecR domain-containing protein [Planctomycetota bacterium]|nr:FecR domain-containing protein [Planctomycetota bacterium]
MNEELFAALLSGYLEGTLSHEQRSQLASAVEADARYREMFEQHARIHIQLAVVSNQPGRADAARAAALIVGDTASRRMRVLESVKEQVGRSGRPLPGGRFWVWGLSSAAALVCLAFVVFLMVSRPPTGVCVVQSCTGDVRASDETPVLPGMRLQAEATLATHGEDSVALVAYGDGTTIEVRGNTRVEGFERGGAKRLKLSTGKIAASVAPQPTEHPMVVEVPGGAATVVGTRFAVSVNKAVSYLRVDEGKVRLQRTADNSAVEVGARQYAYLGVNATRPLATRSVDAPPEEWQAADVGAVSRKGATQFEEGAFTLTSAGRGIIGRADAFYFVHQPLSGNFEITARIVALQRTNNWAMAGIMIRSSLEPDSAHGMSVYVPAEKIKFRRRTEAGGDTTRNEPEQPREIKLPYWVRLVRTGDTLIGYSSPDGKEWTEVERDRIALPDAVLAGLIVSSRNEAAPCTATIDNVSILPRN